MQANIHTPNRMSGESFKAYKDRHIASKKAVEQMTLTGEHSQHKLIGSRQEFRDMKRKTGTMWKIAGAFGRGLRNKFTNKPSKGRI